MEVYHEIKKIFLALSMALMLNFSACNKKGKLLVMKT